MNSRFPALRHLINTSRCVAISFLIAVLSLALVVPPTAVAAPASHGSSPPVVLAQNVDYIGSGTGAALDLGFPVLVPSWVPAPFGGSPSIDAGGGYYSLYWMNAGGEPTFLQVTGTVGGGLPTGSPYDLNVELTINASVNGYGAIHDVTPIYDAVWWIQGGVLYSVQSRNMTGTDSLGLANSLIQFVPPAAPEPTSPPPPPTQPPPPPTQAPAASNPVDESNSGDQGSSSAGTGEDTSQASQQQNQSDPTVTDSGTGSSGEDEAATVTVEPTAPAVGSDGTGIPSAGSDGTGGPPVEIAASDGTGGSDVVVIPRRTPMLEPIP